MFYTFLLNCIIVYMPNTYIVKKRVYINFIYRKIRLHVLFYTNHFTEIWVCSFCSCASIIISHKYSTNKNNNWHLTLWHNYKETQKDILQRKFPFNDDTTTSAYLILFFDQYTYIVCTSCKIHVAKYIHK